jgi:hypothetical protein
MHPSSIPDPSATAHGCARPSEGAPARPPAGDRRPYPNAPTWTRPSYARPGTPRRGRSGPTPPPPIPSTVWTCPPEPRDTRDAVDPVPEVWARATLAAVLAAFTTPGAGVGVLPWPHPTRHAPTRTPPTTSPACVATGAADDLPGPASALDVIAAAGRVPTLLDSCPHTGPDADLAPVVPADPVRRIARPPAERSPATSLRSAAAGSGGGGQCTAPHQHHGQADASGGWLDRHRRHHDDAQRRLCSSTGWTLGEEGSRARSQMPSMVGIKSSDRGSRHRPRRR